MRSFGHRVEMGDMQDTVDQDWNEARLTGFGRVLRLGMTGLMMIGVIVLYGVLDPAFRSSAVVLLLLAALFAAGIYDVFRVLRTRLYWNDTGIKRVGLFKEGRLHLWENLTYVEKSMQDRATVLTFKGLWKVKVYWAYRAHREIANLAKQKRKLSKSSKKRAKKAAASADTVAPAKVEPQVDMPAPKIEPTPETPSVRTEPKLTETP